MEAIFDNQIFKMDLTDEDFEPVTITAQLTDAIVNIPNIPKLNIARQTMSGQFKEELLNQNREHFDLQMTEDPRVKALREKEAEVRRKEREAERRLQTERELNQVRLAIKRSKERAKKIQEQIARYGGPESENYKGLTQKQEWEFRKAKFAAGNTIAVIIGNRKYPRGMPFDPYARNDALAIEQFSLQALRIPKENIYLRINATKGVMEGLIDVELPNVVVKGQTDLLFYYSGHGIAVEKDAKILPSDTERTHAKIIGYSRNDLLQKFANLEARSVAVILDACFTGTTKSGKALLPGKPVIPTARNIDPASNALVITASHADEIAWSSDTYGMSLMTYHLLKGLSGEADTNRDNIIQSDEVESYITKHVNKDARTYFSHNQRPLVNGKGRTLIEY